MLPLSLSQLGGHSAGCDDEFDSREQKNFQLILITHDESFIDEIGKRAHADFYYRVGKDVNNNSVIRRHAIRDDADA
jgi:hypothetical protein